MKPEVIIAAKKAAEMTLVFQSPYEVAIKIGEHIVQVERAAREEERRLQRRRQTHGGR